MPKEIYIYSPIYDETAKIINQSLSDVPESEDVLYRINSPGGYTRAGFSVLSKMSERSGKNNAIIDGDAMSMGAYLLPFFDDVTSNDTSDLMFHIASYPSWYEPTEEEQQVLDRTNNKFKEKLSKKVEGKPGAKKFLDKLFEEGKRNDVYLTPEEARKLGIVNRVRKLEPTAFLKANICAMVDEGQEIKIMQKEKIEQHTKTQNNMTLAEF